MEKNLCIECGGTGETVKCVDCGSTYAPGSKEATDNGCTCPVMDNNYGRGYKNKPGIFVITQGCPLHGKG